MLNRIIIFVVVAILVYLACIFVGGLLLTLNVAIASFVGAFLKEFATVIAVLIGLWYAAVGSFPIL